MNGSISSSNTYVGIVPKHDIVNGTQQDENDICEECSGEVDHPYSGVFEGPEKTLEVFYRRLPNAPSCSSFSTSSDQANTGMRSLSRSDLDRLCRRARCTILSKISNQYLDAYVLSESSLFVYPQVVVLKTCGTTTLLRCIATLIELGHAVGLEIDWIGYSRKNFTFPGDQSFPHESFYQELEYLSSHRSLCERLDGNGYTLGPVTDDHWFVFVADHTAQRIRTDMQDTDRVLNMMMFDIDQTVAEIFSWERYANDGDDDDPGTVRRVSHEQTHAAGIHALCPGYDVDPRAFRPCGYSMNAILFRSYTTMHVTPEMSSSYASFETNQQVASYASLINNVLRTFRPKRLVMTLMADEDGLKQLKNNPFGGYAESEVNFVVSVKSTTTKETADSAASVAKTMVYKRSSVASIQVEDDCCCMMGNWVLQEVSTENDEHISNNARPRGYSVT